MTNLKKMAALTPWVLPLSQATVDDSSWEPDGVTLQVRFCEGGEVPEHRVARRYSPNPTFP